MTSDLPPNQIPKELEESKKHSNVSIDDLYRRSTQYTLWSFTEDELRELKQRVNENGRKVAFQRFEEARKVLEAENPKIFQTHGAELSSEIAGTVTYEEEQEYLYYFSQQIIHICAHFNMPTQVKATAMSFFKKFYLVHSVMEYRPRNVVYTIVFLAAKSENYFISIESFCSRLPKILAKEILDLEFIVLLSLKFTLLVHHPYRPLYGFFLDFQQVILYSLPTIYDIKIDAIGALHDKAKKWLNDHALLSQVMFLFTPPQIALAALYDCDQRITERYLERKFGHQKGGSEGAGSLSTKQYQQLVETIKKCVVLAKTALETSKEQSTRIDEKCFFALNPSKLLKKKIKLFT